MADEEGGGEGDVPRIHRLDEGVVNRIAAGEIIQVGVYAAQGVVALTVSQGCSTAAQWQAPLRCRE